MTEDIGWEGGCGIICIVFLLIGFFVCVGVVSHLTSRTADVVSQETNPAATSLDKKKE